MSEESLLVAVLQVNKGGKGDLILEVVEESGKYFTKRAITERRMSGTSLKAGVDDTFLHRTECNREKAQYPSKDRV